MRYLLLIALFIQTGLSFAQESWRFQYYFGSGFQMLESYDSGVVILAVEEGQGTTGKIIKLDKQGEISWEHTFEEEDEGVLPLAMVEAKNGDLIIAGRTFQYEALADAFIMRINACGEVLWFENIGIIDETDWVTHMVLGEKGSVVACHYRTPPSQQRYNLVKIDASGDMIWSNNLVLDNAWGGGKSLV